MEINLAGLDYDHRARRFAVVDEARHQSRSDGDPGIAPAGDVRAWDDNVFAPWGGEGKREGTIYDARAGRSDTRALMPLEIVPVAADANRFTLIRSGKPVPGAHITVITPDKWSKTFVADAQGVVELPVRDSGRYLLSATLKEAGAATLPGGAVTALHHTTTTTFVAP